MSVRKQSFTIGTYTAINIKRQEAALNGVVARIHVTRLSNEVMDSKLKRGLKRKRGRPCRVVPDEMKVVKQQVPARRRGRPRKFNFEPKLMRDNRTKFVGKNLRDRKSKFNARMQEAEKAALAIVKAKQEGNSVGDEVISFLPVFNNKPKSPVAPYNKKKYPSFSSKEALSPSNPVVILGSDFSSVIHEKSKKTSLLSPKRDASPVTTDATEVEISQNDIELKENKKVGPKSKTNGTFIDRKSEKIYALFVNEDNNNKYIESSNVGEIDFNKLVRSLKQVKLPGPKWKIRIVVSKLQTITEVTFTNKEEYERCIKFSRVFTGYIITFDKVLIKLFGAPTKITTFNDVTILLDIIHNISLNDVLLEYQRDEKL